MFDSMPMSTTADHTVVHVEVPRDLARLSLPEGVDRQLQALLDKQDRGEALTDDERAEAEGLVDLAMLLSLLKLRAGATDPSPEQP
jgi:hypothetical protein